MYSLYLKFHSFSPIICNALTRLLDESTESAASIDTWEKLIDAYLSLGVRNCDIADKELEKIEEAGKRLAATMDAEDVDVVGALLKRIGKISIEHHRLRRKEEL